MQDHRKQIAFTSRSALWWGAARTVAFGLLCWSLQACNSPMDAVDAENHSEVSSLSRGGAVRGEQRGVQDVESCDGIDNDLDGKIDEDFDSDGDFVTILCPTGVAYYVGPTANGCDTSTGNVSAQAACTISEDCNDSDPATYPPNPANPSGAQEVCDPQNADQDCDGYADDQDASVLPSSGVLYYRDLDGDGYGASNSTGSVICDTVPSNYVANNTDCDDTTNTVYQGANEVCDGRDNDCDGNVDEGADRDGDGYSLCGNDGIQSTDDDDCDDNRPDVFPGGTEVCDGLDNDCDTIIDEGFDLDRDTWTTCGPDGHVETVDDNDCDDTNASIYPKAPEYCNDIDDDCDGTVDEDPSESRIWILDQDQDGFGTFEVQKNACSQPDNYIELQDPPLPEDCNDLDPSVYPGSGNERLDGSDTNCDGQIPLIELDCDGDGQYPISRRLLAALQSGLIVGPMISQSCTDKSLINEISLGETLSNGFPNDALFDAETIGLKPCQQGQIPPEISCAGLSSPGTLTLVCDTITGFWVVENYSASRQTSLERSTPTAVVNCDPDFADCDDQRAEVCGCGAELCDGRDTNCARDGENVLDLTLVDSDPKPDGIADAIQKDSLKTGYVSVRELDSDADGALSCAEGDVLDTFGDDYYAWSSRALPADWIYEDCDDRCAIRSPSSQVLCDGVLDGGCESSQGLDSSDPDDVYSESTAFCGYLSSGEQAKEDSLYVLVYDLCPDCKPGDISPRYIPLTEVRSTLPYPPNFTRSVEECSTSSRNCLYTDPTYQALESALVEVEDELPRRVETGTCLPTRLSKVEAGDDPSLELLRLCLPEEGGDADEAAERCKLTRLTLNDRGNDLILSLYSDLITQSSNLCSDSYATRSLWPDDRIRSSRSVVGLWHCIRSGACECLNNDGTTGPVTRSCPRVSDVPSRDRTRVSYVREDDLIATQDSVALPVDMGPFVDKDFVGSSGWSMGCWTTTSPVGGACEGGSRDQIEGPRDIYGLLTDSPGECGSCTDGKDNNCNGLMDEEDPGCYPCFEGQGISCACKPSEDIPTPALGPMLLSGLLTGRIWQRRRRGGQR